MLKKLSVVLAAAVLAFALVGCGNNEPAKDDTEDTVVVYSTHPEKLLTKVADDFTNETGIKVEFINLKGELADRVLSEKDNPQADVMYGGDISVYMQLAEQDCFTKSEPSWANDLDDAYKSADGLWYGTIKTPVMMFYNTNLLNESDAPKDWSDLTNAEYANKIVARDYISSSMRSAVCNLYYYYEKQGGEEAAQNFLKGLDANIKNYYNSGSMMFKAIGNGEAALGISTMNDIIDNRDNNSMPLQYINATSGDVIVTDCVAAINKAPHPNAAQKFLDYVGSQDVQVMLANDFNRMPTMAAALAESPEWMQADITALPADWSVIAENQSTWLDTWQNTIYSQDKTVESSK